MVLLSSFSPCERPVIPQLRKTNFSINHPREGIYGSRPVDVKAIGYGAFPFDQAWQGLAWRNRMAKNEDSANEAEKA